MEKNNKLVIRNLLRAINKNYQYNFKKQEYYSNRLALLKEAYFNVFKEQCYLLNAIVLLDEANYVLRDDNLNLYQYYINSMWQAIRLIPNVQLTCLKNLLNDLLIELFYIKYNT